jgi:hypothetical protein
LQLPQTTSIIDSLMGFPAALASQASGVWSACRSSVLPQSEQNGCNLRARFDSLSQAVS